MQKNKSKIAERSEIIDRGIRSNSRIQDIKHQCKKTENFKEKRDSREHCGGSVRESAGADPSSCKQ